MKKKMYKVKEENIIKLQKALENIKPKTLKDGR